MFYLTSKFHRYPLRNEQFYGEATERLVSSNPGVRWLKEVEETPCSNGNTLLWNPTTTLHCFVNPGEWKQIQRLKQGVAPVEQSNKEIIKHLFLRTMVALNGETFIPGTVYRQGPVYEERYLIEFLMTESCNLSCKYCFAEPNKKRPPMTAEIASAAIDKAMELPVDSFTIEFGGGETFIHFKKFANLVQEIRKKAEQARKDVEIVVQTNGTCLDKHNVMKFLIDHQIQIGVSMDGPPKIHDIVRPLNRGSGSAAQILKSIKMMKHFNQTNIPFLTVVNRYNVDYPEQIVDYFNSLGSDRGMFLPTLKLGAAVNSWEETGIEPQEYFVFMKRMVEYSGYGKKFKCLMIKRMLDNFINPTRDFRCMRSQCGAGQDYIVIDSCGNIYPCSHHVHREELKLGHITDPTPLHQQFTKHTMLNRLFEQRRVDSILQCRRCTWRHLCEAGCTLDSYYHHQKMKAPSTLCQYYRNVYPFLLNCCNQHPEIITAYLDEEVEIVSF